MEKDWFHVSEQNDPLLIRVALFVELSWPATYEVKTSIRAMKEEYEVTMSSTSWSPDITETK